MPAASVTWLAACLLGLSLAYQAAAGDTPRPAGLEHIPSVSSREAMQRPIPLTPGAGRMHQAVSTRSPEAQAYYDQGIVYLHSYVWVDAARSFHEALRRDPELAMAHLGLAKAYTGAEAYAAAIEHLEQAAALVGAGHGTPKEARWIALGQQQMEAIFADPAEQGRWHQEYKAAIDELIVLDPDDAHAWVLRGNAEEPRVSGRGQGGGVGSIAYYESALKRDPGHWGADHYLVHAYEGLGLYEKAAEHAAKYSAAAPVVPHAHHMYAHVLPRLGRWQEALRYLAKADDVQRAYFASGIEPIEEWHHGHNLHLKGAVQWRLGNNEAAERLFREAFHQPVRGLRDGRFTDPWLEFLLLQSRFDEALAEATEARTRALTLARFIGTVRGAEALLALGRVEEAREWHREAKMLLGEFREDVGGHPLHHRLPNSYEQSHLEPLDAQIALVSGNADEAAGRLQEYSRRFLGRRGFDGWVTGLIRLEQLAGFASRVERPDLAWALIEVMRQIDPEYKSRVVVPTPTAALH